MPRIHERTNTFSWVLAGLVLFALTLQPPRIQADVSYKKSRWATRLSKGVLWIRGAGYGTWGKRWTRIADHVESFQEAATTKGPVLIYKLKGKREWRTIQLHPSSGAGNNQRTFAMPVTLLRSGRFGVLIKVGDKSCYDLSWSYLRPIHCNTARYK
jgi:hypothetical protein